MIRIKKNNILGLPLLLALLIGMSGLKVQAQSFQWGAIGGGLNSMQTSGAWFRVVDLATYRDERVYSLALTGTWNLKVAGQSLPGFADIGSTEIALSSFNDQGQHQWSKVIGSNDGASPARVFTDPFGSVYVTGNNIGWRQNYHTDTSVRSTSTNDRPWMFLIKYDSLGSLQWLVMPEPDTPKFNSQAIDALIDSNQVIHWLGYLRKGHLAEFQDTVKTDGVYVIRMDANGNYLGRTKMNVVIGNVDSLGHVSSQVSINRFAGADRVTKFRYDPTRGRYYIGGINDNINPLVVGQDTVQGRSYIAGFDTTGQVVWKRETSNSSLLTNLNDFTLDKKGNIYVTGLTGDKAIFLNNITINTPKGRNTPYIASLWPNGNHRWLNVAATNFASEAYQVTLNNNQVAIAGEHNGLYWNHPTDQDTLLQKNGERSFIARFDTATGDLRGMAEIKDNSSGSNRAWSIASDTRGRYYLGGYFSSKIYLGNQWFTKLGSQRSFYVTQYACDSLQGSLSTAYDSTRGWKLTYRGTPADSVVWQLGDGSPTRQGDSIFHIYQNLGQYPICATIYNNYCGNFSLCDTLNVNRINTTAYPTAVPLEVYPNPAQDRLRVWYPGTEPVAYRLLSPAGATVQQGRLQPGAQKISLTALPPGLYLLQVKSKPVHSVKVIIGSG